jgi:hypothetical protein
VLRQEAELKRTETERAKVALRKELAEVEAKELANALLRRQLELAEVKAKELSNVLLRRQLESVGGSHSWRGRESQRLERERENRGGLVEALLKGQFYGAPDHGPKPK